MKIKTFVLAASAILTSIFSPSLYAQSFSTQERFQDMFVTAGYGTAFGAAMGAALLSFQDEPDQSLRYVAVGASLGFIGGSLLGSYIVFSPVFQVEQERESQLPLALHQSNADFVFRPSIDPEKRQISRLEGIWTIASF
ncbi:MAG: hypothetical protein ACOH5I_03620 [Oligoflexus sp.]